MWDRRTFVKLAFAGLICGSGIYATLDRYRKSNILDIIEYPDPVLRQVSNPVEKIDDAVISIGNAMLKTLQFRAPFDFFLNAALYKGLSAPQIGVQKRLIVCGIYGEARVMVNPVILERKGSYSSEEYCMSLPDHGNIKIKRSHSVIVEYMGLDGNQHRLDAKKGPAALLEHEIDHLNGVLYIDYA